MLKDGSRSDVALVRRTLSLNFDELKEQFAVVGLPGHLLCRFLSSAEVWVLVVGIAAFVIHDGCSRGAAAAVSAYPLCSVSTHTQV